jgi:hypothetical protein
MLHPLGWDYAIIYLYNYWAIELTTLAGTPVSKTLGRLDSFINYVLALIYIIRYLQLKAPK